jgi:hypothetical protein
MNCRDAKLDLALLAGGDLDDAARLRELRRHLATCPDCRRRYQSAQTALHSLRGLKAAATTSTWESGGSLWPAVQQELSRPPQPLTRQMFRQLRHWSPFAAMTAACVLMLVAITFRGEPREQPVTPRGMHLTPPPAVPPASESSRSHGESAARPPAPPEVPEGAKPSPRF